MVGAIEVTSAFAAIGTTTARPPQPGFGQETAILRSACAALSDTAGGVFEAMTVSLPGGDNARDLSALRALIYDVAHEYGVVAQLELTTTRLRVRITRPCPESEDK